MIEGTFILLLLCLLGSAFYSGIETGVVSLHRMRLMQSVRDGVEKAEVLSRFVEDPDRLLGTTLIGTNICNVVISVTAASALHALLGTAGEAVSTILTSIVILIAGEYIPKAWFQSNPYVRCKRFASLLHLSWIIFWPIGTIATALARLLVPGEPRDGGRGNMVTREELKLLALESEEHGILKPIERKMIHNVFELSTRTAQDIMIKRDDMVCIPAAATAGDLYDRAQESGFSRFPVLDTAGNQFVGVVNIYDLLVPDTVARNMPISEYIRPPLFIDSSMLADDIFPRLRLRHQPLCLVRNQQQLVIGMLTTEDLLEEIVGDIQT